MLGVVRQYNLPLFGAAIEKIKFFGPMCVQGLGGSDWIIGAASAASIVEVRCGFFIGNCTDSSPPRFFPNCGSRIRLRTLSNIYGTLHHNHESRHPARFDDAVCRYRGFNPHATEVSELGVVQLVAHLKPFNDISFTGLVSSRPNSGYHPQRSRSGCTRIMSSLCRMAVPW